jgi:hypothetical protein
MPLGPNQTRFYCYSKSAAAIDREVRAGTHRGFVSNPKKPMGYNDIMTFGQRIAQRTGISDWAHCTNHCWRAFGITRMSNSADASITEAMGAACHTTASAHQGYVKTNGRSEMNRIMAMSDVAYK